jgi:hypothetical protein
MGPKPEFMAAAEVILASADRPDLKGLVVALAYELQAATERWIAAKPGSR